MKPRNVSKYLKLRDGFRIPSEELKLFQARKLHHFKICFRIPSEELKQLPSSYEDMMIRQRFRIPSEELKPLEKDSSFDSTKVLEYLVRN